MATQKFSKSDAIKYGFATMKKNFWFFAQIIIIVSIISYVPGIITGAFDEINLPTLAVIFFGIVGLVFWGLQLLISIGVIKIALKFVKGSTGKVGDLFSGVSCIINYFIGSLLYGLIVVVGLVLLIVPGIIFAIKFQFYQYIIVEKNTGPIDALKQSWHMTDGETLNLILLGLLLFGINILGMLALGIGLFATIPTSLLATAWVYKKLSTGAHA
jgi:hypothetical protein